MKQEIPLEFEIKLDTMQALIEGKIVHYKQYGLPEITLIPDRHGVFLTTKKYMELRQRIAMECVTNPDKIFEEALGKDLFEKWIKRN